MQEAMTTTNGETVRAVLRELLRAAEEKYSKVQEKHYEGLGDIRQLIVPHLPIKLQAPAARVCGGVPQAPAQSAPPVMGNEGMQGQGQVLSIAALAMAVRTMLIPVEVTDPTQVTDPYLQARISNKRKKKNRNSNKKEKKNELNLPVFDRNVYQKKIGKLLVSYYELGRGSNGTVVFEGMCDGRKVAVKRLLKAHNGLASKEVNNYIASSQHTNVVSWYGVESDRNFHYLALERCSYTLHELIQSPSFGNQVSRNDQDKDFQLWNNNGYPSPHLMKLIRDMVHGLLHLHEVGIVHRDLKPSNVLILKQRKSICAKLSDMGISKRLADDTSSVTNTTSGYGSSGCSSGWQAPEQLSDPPVKLTRAVDIFSLGCVIFFSLTKGKHPFGERMDKNNGVLANKKKLQSLEKIPEAHHLVDALLNPSPEMRPQAVEILRHPFFWDSGMRLSFLRDASDYLLLKDKGKNVSELVKALKRVKKAVFTGTWDTMLDPDFLNELPGKHNKYYYNYHSFPHLLRVIRNKWSHYGGLSEPVKQIFGKIPEGYDGYFSNKFPKLLMEVYKIFEKYCKEEEAFRIYFKGN